MRKLTPMMKALIAVGAVFALGLAALISVPLLMVMGTTATTTEESLETFGAGCGPVAQIAGTTLKLDDDQLGNAQTIIDTGRSLEIPKRGLVVAVATALQESTLRNLDWGDRDSVGLFQQRAGWGSSSERTDPAVSARCSTTVAAPGSPGCWTSPAGNRCRSPRPLRRYRCRPSRWLTPSGVAGVLPGPVRDREQPAGLHGRDRGRAAERHGRRHAQGGAGPAGRAVRLGGSGRTRSTAPAGGLLLAEAGYQVNIRTAAQMWTRSDPIARGSEQPGDLLFGQFGARGPGPGHVMIVVKPGLAVQAPSTGDVVKLTDYSSYDSGWKIGRFKASALTPLARAA